MVNKRTSNNKAHILLLVRQTILGNIVALRFSSSAIFMRAYFGQCTEPTAHLTCCVKSGLLIFFWYADLLFVVDTWRVNACKKQHFINIYLLDVE
jgi:hypothetical protein